MALTIASLQPIAAVLAAAAAGCAIFAAAQSSAAPLQQPDTARRPSRIISLDLCTDQLLIELGDAARIAAVTHLARDPAVSAIPERANALATTRGGAEDVLTYDPDLVLAGPFGASATVGLLRRLGRRVVAMPLAQDLEGVRSAIRAVASAIGEERRGEVMIADFNARLARLPSPTGPPPTALVYQVGGLVSGPGSLADAALSAAGLRNISAAYPLTRSGRVSLESLLAMPPDLLVLGSHAGEYRSAAADNLSHPVVTMLRSRRPVVELPWRYWLCGTPHIADAIERLAKAREQLEARRP